MALCRADAIRVTGDASNKVVPQASACPWIGQAFSFWAAGRRYEPGPGPRTDQLKNRHAAKLLRFL